MIESYPKSPFLNATEQFFTLHLQVQRELGIIARVALIFSRRGLDIATFHLEESKATECALIKLGFYGNAAQKDSVSRDLIKLVDVERMWTVEIPRGEPQAIFSYDPSGFNQLVVAGAHL